MESKRFAHRVNDIQPFRVVEVLTRARKLEAMGRDIVHMQAGEPDFATAQPIIEAGIAALSDGATHYSDANGLWQLRETIANYYLTDYGVSVDPKRIMITPGASGALLLLAALLIDAGENILMADPGYPCNRNFMRIMEGEGLLVPVDASDNFQLNAELVDRYWVDDPATAGKSDKSGGVDHSVVKGRTVGALVATPSNPTGTMLSREQLSELYETIDRRGGHLLVDEIYHGLDFRNEQGQRSAHSILEITDQAFVINSFSKYFGMTGWRLGWLVAPEWALPALEKLAQNVFISMSTMGQYAALACFEPATRAILDARRDEFKQRCDFLLPQLRDLGFIVPQPPAGGLYIYADVSRFLTEFGGRFGSDSQAFCMHMLEEHGLAMTPGADFGYHHADKYVRFAFTTSAERLQVGVERMRDIFTE